MGEFSDNLRERVSKVLATQWETRVGTVVPDESSIPARNYAVELDAAILYADLAKSTGLVDGYKWWFAGEMYKTFLECSALCIKRRGGEIVSYDGDRIMAVFMGDAKCNSAVRTGLDINHVVSEIINPNILRQYPTTAYKMQHGIGIDRSTIHAAKVGVRGDNDLVWIGRAANRAAKLSDLRIFSNGIYISDEVYSNLNEGNKLASGTNMWTTVTWNSPGEKAYASGYMTKAL